VSKAAEKESLLLEGPAGTIEALLEIPPGCDASRVVLICHPHPLYQGTMLNKVVHTLARAMHDMGLPTLRFNFRGVGRSTGEHAKGVGEVDDTLWLAEWLRERFPGAKLWLAGFSFGGMVAALAAARTDAEELITIAPAVGMIDSAMEQEPAARWLLVQGDADELIEVAQVQEWAGSLKHSPEVIILPGVTHFFHGELVTLRKLLVEKLSD